MGALEVNSVYIPAVEKMCTKVSKFIREINKRSNTPYTVCTADDAFNWAAAIYERTKNEQNINTKFGFRTEKRTSNLFAFN